VNLSPKPPGLEKCSTCLRRGLNSSGTRVRSCSKLLVGVLVALLFAVHPTISRAQSQVDEYRLKAAFLFHFAQFVEWPPEALGNGDAPFVICIAGQDPFRGGLEETVQGKLIASRPVRIRHIKQVQEGQECRVLFVGKGETEGVSPLTAALKNMPVLTVGESDDFLQKSGIIRFCVEDRKVRFEVNQEAAETANLKISSRLLLLAKTVVGSKGR
jgi:YfiR/HmsC-like